MAFPRQRWASVNRALPATLEEAFAGRVATDGFLQAVELSQSVLTTAPGVTLPDGTQPRTPVVFVDVRPEDQRRTILLPTGWLTNDEHEQRQAEFAAAAPLGCRAIVHTEGPLVPAQSDDYPVGGLILVAAATGS